MDVSTSALGQKQTLVHVSVMSALPPKADISLSFMSVCFEDHSSASVAMSALDQNATFARVHAMFGLVPISDMDRYQTISPFLNLGKGQCRRCTESDGRLWR